MGLIEITKVQTFSDDQVRVIAQAIKEGLQAGLSHIYIPGLSIGASGGGAQQHGIDIRVDQVLIDNLLQQAEPNGKEQ